MSILNDAVPEDILEYFSLVLISTDPAVLLNPVIANITLIDDSDGKHYQMSTVIMFVYTVYYVYCVSVCYLLIHSGYNWIQHSS